MSNYRFSRHKYYIELFALVLYSLNTANFQHVRTSSEEFRVRLGHGLFRTCQHGRLLGRNLRNRTRISESLRPNFLFSKFMKKSLLLIFLSIFSFATIHADITWTLSGDGTLTISGTNMPDYTIPWYSQRYEIKKVEIENGVTNIGNCAFYECSNLTLITIPNSVTSIGNRAFYNCANLTSITIPNSVTSIADFAFFGCNGLTSITIPESVTSIGGSSFYECIGLTSITIPKYVPSIGSATFVHRVCRLRHFLAKLIAGIAKIKDFECFSAYLTMQSNRFSIKLSAFTKNFTNEARKNIIITQFMARLACKDCTNFDSRNRTKWGF